MDDLISRKAAIQSIDEKIEEICEENDLTAYKERTASMCREWFVDEIAKAPTVPAMPLDKLCEWLEVHARTPIYNMQHTAEWWKEELERWMEAQDAAD